MRTVLTDCILCGTNQTELHARGKDFEYGTTGNAEWVFLICRNCGTIFLSPRPESSELATIYPPNYYAYNFNTRKSLGYRIKALLDKYAARGYLRFCRRPGPILDIGCGDGRLLSAFSKSGVKNADLYGLELAGPAVAKGRALGFQVQQMTFEEATFPEGKFELIVLQQVIEHVPNPREMLKKIKTLLAERASVIIETPNVASWDHALFHRRYWGGYHIPRHFYLFNPTSLTELCAQSGLEVIDIKFLVSPSFWIQSIHHWLSEHSTSTFLRRLFHPQVPSILPLSIFTGLDIFGKMFGITSNMRIVARRR